MDHAALISNDYLASLRDYLDHPDEVSLQRAYEIGRTALAHGIGVLAMATLQHETFLKLLNDSGVPPEFAEKFKSAQSFFLDSLSPFEMTHSGFQEANAALRRMNETLEEEVKRISHVLHGEAGQLLAVVHIALEDLGRDLTAQNRQRILRIREMLDQIESQLRRLSHEMHPALLDDLGVIPALEFLVTGIAKRTGLSICIAGDADERFSAAIEMAIYRAVKEALNNVAKHARASRVDIRLVRENGEIRCSVKDDGAGFDPAELAARTGERGFGLFGITERLKPFGGSFQILSAPGEGTEVTLTIPWEKSNGDTCASSR